MGVPVELIEHDIGVDFAPDLDDHAHSVAVRFVAEIGDPLDAFVARELGDVLDHARLVDLVRDLGNDDG